MNDLRDLAEMEHNQEPVPIDAGWKKKTTVFLSSQNTSLFGTMLVQYAIIWYVTLSTKSGLVLTISTVAAFLPQIVISLFAGVWADRYPRKWLIIAADALTATSTLILAIFFLLGYRELWMIFLISGIRSVGQGIQMPAVNALLPQIAPTDKLIRVNSINGTLQPIISIATPVIAGALMSFSHLEWIFFIDVITAAIAISLMVNLKVPAYPKAAVVENAGYFGDLRAGLAYIRQSRSIRTLFIFFGFVMFLVAPVAFLTPLLVTRSFGPEVWKLTANEVTFFGGSILGGIIMTAWGGFKNRFRTLGLACIVWAVLFVSLGITKDFVVYLVIMTLAGIPMPFWGATSTTLLQELVPQEMQGRVFGVQQMIMSTVMPVGMVVFGPIADVISIEVLLMLASGLMALPGLWIFFSRQPIQFTPNLPARDYERQIGD
jgi:DHA3 family macrolide efflux protein-like MFS transporter